MKSTHACNLIIPRLLTAATKAHIVTDLEHASLISIKMLIDAGSQVSYNDRACTINSTMTQFRQVPDLSSGLWIIPLNSK